MNMRKARRVAEMVNNIDKRKYIVKCFTLWKNTFVDKKDIIKCQNEIQTSKSELSTLKKRLERMK